MLNAKLALVMVGVTAAMWGCGDDDKPSGTGGRGGTAGSAGQGGATGGTAGKAGTGGATGGSAGKGGAGGTAGATGGTAGKGGTAGSGGTAGTTGGTAGSAGTAPVGGQGGEGGDAFGGAGGEGGGATNLTIAQACAATCQDQMGLACDNACVASCIGLAADDGTFAPTEYAALIQCQATELGASDYVCREQPSFPSAPDMAGLVWDGPCETELCEWTCADGTFVDEDTYGHCGC
jgi:hypothetical protein